MIKIKYNYDISNISYIKVGGKVKLYIETDDLFYIQNILNVTKKIKYIGNTSNIFFSFYYSDYIFIKYINKTIVIGNNLEVGSSVSLKYLNRLLIKKSISGFEKLDGIPCLIGGGIINNASSFNQEISENLIKIQVLTSRNKIVEIYKNEIDFSYHNSSLKYDNLLIIKAFFKIIFKDKKLINSSNEYVINMRRKTQPYNKLTLGSTFKKYESICIPKLIEELNCKGRWKNVSCVSLIHSNFIEIGNKENFENIISLIEEVNQLLYNKLSYYIDLEIETMRGKNG